MGNTNPALEAARKASKEMFAAIESNTCFRVEAGAGAGKTYSLVEALQYLIEKKAGEYEKRSQQIACITYTNVAAEEIKERTDNHPIIFTDTIHAFSWNILKGFQPTLRGLIPRLSEKWAGRMEEAGGIKSQKVIYDLGYPKADEDTIELHHDDVIKLMTKFLEKPKFQSVLKSKYPVLFIDEYQDTNIDLAASLVKNLIEKPSGMLIGLFGDHWQKIYGTKACGLIENEQIKEIGKNANFRSDKNIVECLNRMRPELPQNEVDQNSSGKIYIFHSNAFEGARRTQNHWQQDLPEADAHDYLERTIAYLKKQGWSFDKEHSKILMLTNNVLASEQGYRNLVDCFRNTDDYLKKNDHYIKYFLDTIEPMCEQFLLGRYGKMFSVLGNKHPRLSSQKDKKVWSNDINRLIELRKTGNIREVLELIKETSHPRLSAKVASAEEKLSKIIEAEENGEEIDEADQRFIEKIRNIETVSYKEVINLYCYIEDKTPFSTKHGVKGAEFDEVLVVCGRGWNHYDWNQFLEWFGGTVPSPKQDAYERNRNLFYVSCSRAKKKLALLFTQKLSETALQQVEHIFGKGNVYGEPNKMGGMMSNSFQINEKYLSQIPALQLLIGLGFEFLTPEEALHERQDRTSNVLLENILRNQLKEINRIRYKGSEYLFSEENVQSAIQKLKNIKYDGLLKTNETIYDLITLGTAMEQTIEGDSKSFNLNYVDWRNPVRNKFHVTVEYSVERSRSTETARPDIVLFVNGIPFCVIECKAPQVEVEQAVSQVIRNQNDNYIPKLFIYSQLVMAVNKNSAMYATTGTAAKFWGVWKEPGLTAKDAKSTKFKELEKLVQESLSHEIDPHTFSIQHSALSTSGERLITEQDKALFSLCRPERLLELAWKFTVFDGGIKKIARYQQYFVIKSTLNRVKHFDSTGSRKGGVIWHTQGSGKSLTMVMLARNLALDLEILNPRIVLVTDRDDLDKQLGNTFAACGLEANRATSGRNLLELVAEKKSGIITTLIHKFDKAYAVKKYQDDSPDIFILVDESHRTQFGSFSARMRQMFPRACYLGFTGTPLLKKEKNNFDKFGDLIEPHYSITQAVDDGAVVPLLYEGRHVEMTQNQSAVDLWFERHTQGLSKEQQADLKRKYARAEMLNKADQVIYMRVFDISEHFRSNWQGTGFKAQLVAPNKVAALKYNAYLNEIGIVSSEVVISPPDMREGYEETDDETTDEVVKFWQKMMKRYGSEEEYTKQLINQFKHGRDPEILIVVDKLLTGFDAPRNAVLYLCRVLREHALLQAIARVNRLHEGKEFGFIIDYANILGELDKALTMYSAFEGFDESDLVGTLVSINSEIEKLPGRYSDLWDLFKTVKHSYDEEAYEVLLADESLREEFYSRLSEFGKNLSIALSSEKFLSETDEKILSRYKTDLRKFQSLKASVKLRYAEAIDYRDYEPKIKKLLDTHIQANEVIQLNEPVNIFDDKMFNQVKEEQGVYQARKTTASKADTIAYATKKVITEKMDEDPHFYEKFSKLIQQAIEDFRAKRISDLDYLNKVVDIRNKIVGKVHEDIPDKLSGNEDAMAYYGVLKPFLEKNDLNKADLEIITADTAIAIRGILEKHKKVQFWDDEDAQKQTVNEIDDYLYDELKTKKGIELSFDQMDDIIEKVLQVAKHRSYK